uniref:MULE transposase domain-containing protein n=1 Tax=Lactuca sativa TaxID=4236 RepID=A0A9R1XBZ9_LACSA|nr:hypothetical protein LSAT_V11C500272370 [Lactuca sativa]
MIVSLTCGKQILVVCTVRPVVHGMFVQLRRKIKTCGRLHVGWMHTIVLDHVLAIIKNLNSATIALYILHSIEKDVAYPVKHIQSYIKNSMNVDVSYDKAWHGRRKAIKSIYGTWESNFDKLPKYIAALQASNPDTIFIITCSDIQICFFWAFGPAIDVFRLCRPVILVDGCYLKGSYRGKMLVAITKDANNSLLRMLSLMNRVDTVGVGYFYQLRHFVVQNKQLCVVSDRHKGIIHAMENLPEWKEPLAYHRFCLRHIRSNFMQRYKNVRLEKLCWSISSTTQRRKFVMYMNEIKNINLEA